MIYRSVQVVSCDNSICRCQPSSNHKNRLWSTVQAAWRNGSLQLPEAVAHEGKVFTFHAETDWDVMGSCGKHHVLGIDRERDFNYFISFPTACFSLEALDLPNGAARFRGNPRHWGYGGAASKALLQTHFSHIVLVVWRNLSWCGPVITQISAYTNQSVKWSVLIICNILKCSTHYALFIHPKIVAYLIKPYYLCF